MYEKCIVIFFSNLVTRKDNALMWICCSMKFCCIYQVSGSSNDQVILKDIMMDRVQRSLEAALAALYIMTSHDMPKVCLIIVILFYPNS